MVLRSFARSAFNKYIAPVIQVIGRNLNYAFNDHSPLDKFRLETKQESYDHFKKYFYDSLLFEDRQLIRIWAINQSLKIHLSNPPKNAADELYFEFGVESGPSINLFADILLKHNKTIYGFDSYLGFDEDWVGTTYPKGFYKGAYSGVKVGGVPPKVRENVQLVTGRIEDTLDRFLEAHQDKKVNFVHMDVDTYSTTKFILERVKPKLNYGCVVLFDQLHNYSGWKVNEHKALTEVFDEKEFKFIAFDLAGYYAQSAAIKFIGETSK